jgi:hypothetical protein
MHFMQYGVLLWEKIAEVLLYSLLSDQQKKKALCGLCE